MFSIQKKLKSDSANNSLNGSLPGTPTGASSKKPVDLRQRLLQKEFDSLKLPVGCSIVFDNPDVLHSFRLVIKPDHDSLWKDGKFEFVISVPEGYNFEVSSSHLVSSPRFTDT